MNPDTERVDGSQEKSQNRRGASKRFTKIQRLFSPLRNRRRQALLYFACLVVLFAVLGFAQHKYVHFTLQQTSIRVLAAGADEVATEINYKNGWDLKGYRNASPNIERGFVLASDGLIVEVVGELVLGVLGPVTLVDESVLDSPKSVVSSVGESWRLLGKKINGGVVVVGIPSRKNTRETDSKLTANLQKFGSNLDQARSIRTREIDWEVDFSVISTAGDLVRALGGIPLRADLRDLPMGVRAGSPWMLSDGSRTYRAYSEAIRGTNDVAVGTIIVLQDVTPEFQALAELDRFNIALVLAALALSCILAFAFTASALLRRHASPTLEEALKVGESKTVEFKSAYHWDPNRGKAWDERRFAVLRAITGFLNSDGGTLYIGVEEVESGRATIRGIEEDLRLVNGDIDKLRLSLTDQIAHLIGDQFSPFITDRIEQVDSKSCWIVAVDPSPQPAFVRWKDRKWFFVREGPRTRELDNEGTWRYIKNRWG